MNKDWKSCKLPIGTVAVGNEFYLRDNIVEEIWDELQKGNSVLLAAPRRVGKTSIMRYMEENPIDNYKIFFQNIQSITSADKFYERVYMMLLNCLSKTKKVKKWFENFVKSKSIIEIRKDGIVFEDKPTDFLKETNALLVEINGNAEMENIVLLLDELPEVLFNINEKDAVSILKTLRHWRQQPEMSKKVKFVLAGSIGIHYVVEKIETRNSDLNDLAKVVFEPLSDNEAHSYIDWATKGATITYSSKLKKHLLNKIQYFVPYFINLLIDEIDRQAKKANNPKITTQSIDAAFDTVVKNNDYFNDWKKRLQNYMPPMDFDFVNEILKHTAHKEYISVQEIYDKAVKYEKTADYMEFINELEKDGYIVEFENKYLFISPFLSAFWKRNNPIYNT
ncbi:MAG: AAA-like domain-containing protein [Dysgonamonadaceae bacterium]|jgi:hypothetical protein|nr:AAA-like domain-containing protein [Dysgonamonadaceae bacterium]